MPNTQENTTSPSLRRFEFKLKLLGFEKTLRVNGTDFNNARENLNASILKSIEIKEHREVLTTAEYVNKVFKKVDEKFKKIFDKFDEAFKQL